MMSKSDKRKKVREAIKILSISYLLINKEATIYELKSHINKIYRMEHLTEMQIASSLRGNTMRINNGKDERIFIQDEITRKWKINSECLKIINKRW